MSHYSIHSPLLLPSIVLGFFLVTHAPTINADIHESTPDLQSIVRSFITEHVKHNEDERMVININALDPKTTALRCDSDIQASFANGSTPDRFNAIALQCYSAPSWTIYVPVSVQLMSSVLAANRVITPGEIITEHDLAYVESDKNRLYDGFFKEKQDLVGLSVIRTISTDTILTKRMVRQVAMIKRNQTVTLIIKKGAIEVTMLGIAKSDGYLNDSVKIWNPTSKKIIDALVLGADRAQIIC